MRTAHLTVVELALVSVLVQWVAVVESYRQAFAPLHRPIASWTAATKRGDAPLPPTKSTRRRGKKHLVKSDVPTSNSDHAVNKSTIGPELGLQLHDANTSRAGGTSDLAPHSDSCKSTSEAHFDGCASIVEVYGKGDVLGRALPLGGTAGPERRPSLHEQLVESPEFQLHIPPIANFRPPLRKALTKGEVYAQHVPEARLAGEDYGDYAREPLQLHEMARSGEIPDFRHGGEDEVASPGDAKLFTWEVERPPDAFIINWSGVVHSGYRDGLVVAARAMLQLTTDQPKEMLAVLKAVAEERRLPMWLATRARYAQPFLDSAADWLPALQYFINHCNERDMLAEEATLEALADTEARPVDVVQHITEGGDPNKLVDLGRRQREEMGIEAFELDGWKSDGARYNDLVSTYDKMLKQLGIESGRLEKCYEHAWRDLYDETAAWSDVVRYRTRCDELDAVQRQNHEAYNCAVVSAIRHHLEVFRVPVYFVSDFKSTDALRREMAALGVAPLDESHVYGRDRGPVVDSVRALLRALDLDRRVPVHYFDDRLARLEAVASAPDLDRVRAYFADWGRSTYSEKLGALYADGVKYVKTSAWLVRFMATPATEPGREWTHGLRLRRPDEEAAQSLMDWKKKWHRLPQLAEVPQRPMLNVL
ncbi:uncharacterized protein BcabD6B2_34990 [Babesia caballi]|uniref:Transmembrane protein, putative n=1 Tax=Babesia caballi TaxID=5871 RepID=A0AAV4LZV9_BABCB|nr:transmembrane protein, putative [Babesia caballi]